MKRAIGLLALPALILLALFAFLNGSNRLDGNCLWAAEGLKNGELELREAGDGLNILV